jgi:hypothetical protein
VIERADLVRRVAALEARLVSWEYEKGAIQREVAELHRELSGGPAAKAPQSSDAKP